MSGQTCMRIDKKNVIDAICKSNSWQCVQRSLAWCILGHDSISAMFININEDSIFCHFVFLDDLYYAMTHADEIFVDAIRIKNPYYGLTDEQILIKCDLESSNI